MRLALSAICLTCSAVLAFSQSHDSGRPAHQPSISSHNSGQGASVPANAEDTRIFVAIPEPMNSHMLANMRDHLTVLEEIQAALAKGDTTAAARIAENRIGMSSLEAHGASHIAGFMPKGMQEAGSHMHRAASRFSTIAVDSGVSGDIKPALSALSEVTRACVGCHAGYKTR